MKGLAFALSAVAFMAAINTGTISSAAAAEQGVVGAPVAASAPFPVYPGRVVAEGAPCAPTMKDGRTPHYTWTAGYVQKARWEYHWACVL